jgi:hypothetical protein
MRGRELVDGLRRFGLLVVGVVVFTALVSLIAGLALGASPRRSVSVGLELVGALFVAVGFFSTNRAPVRAENPDRIEPRGLLGGLGGASRWATRDELDDAFLTSVTFVALGLTVLILGLALSPRGNGV